MGKIKNLEKLTQAEVDEVYDAFISQVQENDEKIKNSLLTTDRKKDLDEYLEFADKNKCKRRGGKNDKK